MPADSLQKPTPGAILQVRTRHYVTESVTPDPSGTVVSLSCLDDDAQGTPLEIIWEMEQDGRIVTDDAWSKIGSKGFDPRERFASFFNTLRWHCVTATNPRIFQSPFRAGIRLDAYQLEPLAKALLLPKVNLFIADDVGLGKTIEAGLIANELLLRRRISNIVVSCPPAMLGQWKDELETRFGLSFEILDRAYLEKIRRQYGYGVNPWKTFPRFLVSQRLLIDELYTAPLREWLGTLKPGSLFILDEAHHAAPSSGAKYAVDSKITRAIRDLAPRFEHRLFLSATPHNGHSNSFSALLNLLDPQRFLPGVPPTKENLEAVMVRRLKEDIRRISGGFPERKVIAENITATTEEAPELQLAELLDQYREKTEEILTQATRKKQIEFQLVASNLQQRLFSSVEALARTLAVHRRSLEKKGAASGPFRILRSGIDRESDLATLPEDEQEAAFHSEIEAASAGLSAASSRLALLEKMTSLAENARHLPDARIARLLSWMQENQCPGIGFPGKSAATPSAPWTEIRVIIFTEYEATLRYLRTILNATISGTDAADERIAIFYGSTPTDQREAIKTAFNSSPATNPVRILLATDAAREGLNLQAHCHHLFHFDVPWNPGRIEQRNGRIDRKLQPAPSVFCHYFRYENRPEDRILQTLVNKTETIKQQLGSLSQILEEKTTTALSKGIRRSELDLIENSLNSLSEENSTTPAIEDELESQRVRSEKLREQITRLDRQLESSRKALHYNPVAFEAALSSSLEISGFPPLGPDENGEIHFPVDLAARDIDPTWSTTIDSLRQPPKDGKRDYLWRKNAKIRPITFTPPDTIESGIVQLHLGHRIAQRLLSRFLSQGFIYDELSRTCFAQSEDKISRVVLLGRLGLYGPGASRLHEEIVTITARWTEPGNRAQSPLTPYARDAEARTMQILEGAMTDLRADSNLQPEIIAMLQDSMSRDVTVLRPHLESIAKEASAKAAGLLEDRARIESEAIVKVLEAQRRRVELALTKNDKDNGYDPAQGDLPGIEPSARQKQLEAEKRQFDENKGHWKKWLEGVDAALTEEPARIRDFYQIKTTRIEPVGLVYLWPA
jgi:SNF2 family DNA or RNA helicase